MYIILRTRERDSCPRFDGVKIKLYYYYLNWKGNVLQIHLSNPIGDGINEWKLNNK